MSIKEFIETLEQSNFSLVAENGKLVLKGDKEKLTAEQIDSIRRDNKIISYIKEKKEELIEYVSSHSNQNISSMYPLSALQEGMLFYGLYNKNAGIFIEHLKCGTTFCKAIAFSGADFTMIHSKYRCSACTEG